MKCKTSFNHFSCRDEKSNKGLVTNKCPRCNKIENWLHVMTCEGAEDLKEKHVYNLIEGIKKVQNAQHLSVEWIVSDIRACLKRDDRYEHKTTQSVIGIENLFRGWIVKN